LSVPATVLAALDPQLLGGLFAFALLPLHAMSRINRSYILRHVQVPWAWGLAVIAAFAALACAAVAEFTFRPGASMLFLLPPALWISSRGV
jgi:hypothetical protein